MDETVSVNPYVKTSLVEMNIKYEVLEKFFPVEDSRKEVTKKLVEAERRMIHVALEKKTPVALITSTGGGKTTLNVAFTIYLAKMGERVFYITKGEANRVDLTIRFASSVKRMLDRGERPPSILILFSRYVTCPNEEVHKAIKEEIEQSKKDLSPEEKEGLQYLLFYEKCDELKRKGLCPFYKNALKVKGVLSEMNFKPMLVSRKVDKKISPIYKYIYSYGSLKDVDFVMDFKDFSMLPEVSRLTGGEGVCVFELLPELVKKFNIVVLDHWHLAIINLMKWLKNELTRSWVVVDEFHEVPSLLSYVVRVNSVMRIIKKLGLKEEFDQVSSSWKRYRQELVEKIVEDDRKRSELEKYGVAAIPVDRPRLESIFSRDLIDKVLAKIAKNIETKGKGVRNKVVVNKLKSIIYSQFISPYYVTTKEGQDFIVGVVHIPLLQSDKPILLLSATATKYDIWNSVKINVSFKDLDKFIDVVRVGYPRATYVIPVDASYEKREEVVKLLKWIESRSPTLSKVKSKVIKVIIAANSWKPLIEKYIKVYTPPPLSRLTPEAKVAVQREILNKVQEGVWIHLSPHSGLSTGLDLIDPAEEWNVVAVVLGESTPKPNVASVALLEHYVKTYGRGDEDDYRRALYILSIRRGVMRVLQALGRLQRSYNHNLEVWFIGKHFAVTDENNKVVRGLLTWYYYQDLYGTIQVVTPQELR